MHSQVVVEVVELPEEFIAAHLVTFKDFLKTVGSWVHKLEDAEVPRAWFLMAIGYLIVLLMSTVSLAFKKIGELRLR